MELLLPRVKEPEPILPSYVKLDMAFGLGSGSTLFDKTRYRSHGAITGASWAAGLHGYALDFDPAIPSYVEIPATHTQLNFTSENFSIIARLYVDDISATRRIFIRGRPTYDGYDFYFTMDQKLFIITAQAGASQTTFSAVGAINAGAWYTVGLSRDGATIRLYSNGEDQTFSFGTHINPATCARSAKIGIYEDKVLRAMDGKMEFLRVFGGVALSATEHLAWHNALA